MRNLRRSSSGQLHGDPNNVISGFASALCRPAKHSPQASTCLQFYYIIDDAITLKMPGSWSNANITREASDSSSNCNPCCFWHGGGALCRRRCHRRPATRRRRQWLLFLLSTAEPPSHPNSFYCALCIFLLFCKLAV